MATPPIPEPTLRLGADSDKPSTAMSWIGYSAPTEQAAAQGPVDQPALSLAAPAVPEQPSATPSAPQQPTSAPAAEEQPEAATAAAAESPPLQDAPREPDVAVTPPAAAGLSWRKSLQDALETIARVRAAASPPPQQSPAPRAAPPVPPSTVGSLSDRESVASAIRGATVVRPGQVLSAGGLDVRTVQPRWGRVTMRTAKPRNPTVAVTFAKTGKVKLADFAKDGDLIFDAGSPDLNEPLLNAVYAWTATGKALEALPNDDSAGITVLFRIILTP
jgi:hypothetical protein